MILQEYLRENVKEDPNGLFLISGEEQYTYSKFYEEVKRFCEERTASYKVPDMVEFVTELPKNTSGKVLKKSLLMSHETEEIKIERI